MRGQRLFIRPIEGSDAPAIEEFLRENGRSGAPACGLLGKLVGDLVAVVAMEITDEGLRVDDIVVARHLRKKRIGRFMLEELARLARKMDRNRLIVVAPREAREFFLRVGFVADGSSNLIREIP